MWDEAWGHDYAQFALNKFRSRVSHFDITLWLWSHSSMLCTHLQSNLIVARMFLTITLCTLGCDIHCKVLEHLNHYSLSNFQKYCVPYLMFKNENKIYISISCCYFLMSMTILMDQQFIDNWCVQQAHWSFYPSCAIISSYNGVLFFLSKQHILPLVLKRHIGYKIKIDGKEVKILPKPVLCKTWVVIVLNV